MILPTEIENIINEYAKPLTRPDYKKGSYMMRNLVLKDSTSETIFRSYITRCSENIQLIKLCKLVFYEYPL